MELYGEGEHNQTQQNYYLYNFFLVFLSLLLLLAIHGTEEFDEMQFTHRNRIVLRVDSSTMQLAPKHKRTTFCYFNLYICVY